MHITKKKGTSIYQKMLTNSNRNEEVEKEADGFRLTFSKIPERKQSEFSMINSIRKTKRYWRTNMIIYFWKKRIISDLLSSENCKSWVFRTHQHCLGYFSTRTTSSTTESHVLAQNISLATFWPLSDFLWLVHFLDTLELFLLWFINFLETLYLFSGSFLDLLLWDYLLLVIWENLLLDFKGWWFVLTFFLDVLWLLMNLYCFLLTF